MDYKEKISEYYTSEHQKSQQKIKYGIICIIAIPLVFLILMFTMKSSKLVYLVLWIAALFIISAYLISVEYKDYTMQKQLKEFIGEDINQPLIELPNKIELVQKPFETQKEYENIFKKFEKEHEKTGQKDRTTDLEKEIQMLREIAQLRTQLGMGDYSNLYKDNDTMD